MHLSNKLAAVSLAVTDAALAADAGLAATAVAALIAGANSPPLAIGEIALIVGLTHSATVRSTSVSVPSSCSSTFLLVFDATSCARRISFFMVASIGAIRSDMERSCSSEVIRFNW